MNPKQGTEDGTKRAAGTVGLGNDALPKDFRDTILPIVYYEGIDRRTAGMQLQDRVLAVEGMEDNIPNFSYKE